MKLWRLYTLADVDGRIDVPVDWFVYDRQGPAPVPAVDRWHTLCEANKHWLALMISEYFTDIERAQFERYMREVYSTEVIAVEVMTPIKPGTDKPLQLQIDLATTPLFSPSPGHPLPFTAVGTMQRDFFDASRGAAFLEYMLFEHQISQEILCSQLWRAHARRLQQEAGSKW